MEDFIKKYGEWGLIAGAAEGLGEAWSRSLANRKMNLVMVDNNEPALHELASALERKEGIKTIRLTLDLARGDAPEAMISAIHDIDCRLFIYNAAYSKVQPFLNNTPGDLENYVNVNARSLILTALPFSEKCRKAGGGGMIFMSSLAALWGTRLLGPYGATKAFDYILAEALHYELKPYGIEVMACVAGATATPAYLATGPKYGWLRPAVMQPADVVEQALGKLEKKAFYIPGFSNRFNHFLLSRILSRKMARGLFNATTGKMYRDRF